MATNKSLGDLEKRFAAIPKAIRDGVKPSIDRGADELVGRMRYLAPDEDGTGKLKRSIRKEPGPVELSVTVAAGGPLTTDAKGDDHALNQEYGTIRMHRHSFFWPSVNTLKKRVRRRIDRAISKAIREAWQD